jgi:hypothetical protein
MTSVAHIIPKLVGVRCLTLGCRKVLVVRDEGRIIIKNNLLILDEEKGSVELKCSDCRKTSVFLIAS